MHKRVGNLSLFSFITYIIIIMNRDFRKYATQHLGINGMALDEVIKSQAQSLNPYILEERQLNVTQMDVFSRLMMERIIFLGTPIDDIACSGVGAIPNRR